MLDSGKDAWDDCNRAFLSCTQSKHVMSISQVLNKSFGRTAEDIGKHMYYTCNYRK